jgi:hypothetical protein
MSKKKKPQKTKDYPHDIAFLVGATSSDDLDNPPHTMKMSFTKRRVLDLIGTFANLAKYTDDEDFVVVYLKGAFTNPDGYISDMSNIPAMDFDEESDDD